MTISEFSKAVDDNIGSQIERTALDAGHERIIYDKNSIVIVSYICDGFEIWYRNHRIGYGFRVKKDCVQTNGFLYTINICKISKCCFYTIMAQYFCKNINRFSIQRHVRYDVIACFDIRNNSSSNSTHTGTAGNRIFTIFCICHQFD